MDTPNCSHSERLIAIATAGGSCATCRHFKPGSDYEAPFGLCTMVPFAGDRSWDADRWAKAHDDEWPDWTDGQWATICHPEATAYTIDGSGYRSDLYVHPDRHVCVGWGRGGGGVSGIEYRECSDRDDLRERIARAAACAYMRVPVEAMDPRIIIEPMWPEVADAVLAVLPPLPAPPPAPPPPPIAVGDRVVDRGGDRGTVIGVDDNVAWVKWDDAYGRTTMLCDDLTRAEEADQ